MTNYRHGMLHTVAVVAHMPHTVPVVAHKRKLLYPAMSHVGVIARLPLKKE